MQSLYNKHEDVQVQRVASDALLVLDSADRSSSSATPGTSTLAIPQTQPWNQFRLQKPENLVQGGFTRLQLTEINFPYAIPNIVPGRTDSLWVKIQTPAVPGGGVAQIVLSAFENFFLSGPEIATELTIALNADPVVGTGGPDAMVWTVVYNITNGFFTVGSVTKSFCLYPVNPNLMTIGPSGTPTATTVAIPKTSLLSMMGYDYYNSWGGVLQYTGPAGIFVSSYATLTFTQYIDIVSSRLTQYQKVKDGSTKVASTNNIICRLFIADENSALPQVGVYYNSTTSLPVTYQQGSQPGSRPFNIHRQFQAPKSFLWDKNTAVDWCDITLLDDEGQLLYYYENGIPPDFQITFKCSED